jgi:hypothetical protein
MESVEKSARGGRPRDWSLCPCAAPEVVLGITGSISPSTTNATPAETPTGSAQGKRAVPGFQAPDEIFMATRRIRSMPRKRHVVRRSRDWLREQGSTSTSVTVTPDRRARVPDDIDGARGGTPRWRHKGQEVASEVNHPRAGAGIVTSCSRFLEPRWNHGEYRLTADIR